MLAVYRSLARLRAAWPELTDPSFGAVTCTADEDTRLFTMTRGRLLMAIDFGDAAVSLRVGEREVLFAAGAGVTAPTAC